jgi:The ARF-like 2 binding protein BART
MSTTASIAAIGGGGGGGGVEPSLFSALDASNSNSDSDTSHLSSSSRPSSPPSRFDSIVSALEECVMGGDAPLQAELEAWCRSNCIEFTHSTPSEGHPLNWMSLFTTYTTLIETRLDATLHAMNPPAELVEVEELFTARADELAGDVFDVLFSLGDYDEFVSLMRSYNEQVSYEEGKGGSAVGFAGLAPVVIKTAR